MVQPRHKTVKDIPEAKPTVIASRDNQWLMRFRTALSGQRDENEIIGVEGVRLVEAALGSGLPVKALLISVSGARHLDRISPLLANEIPLLQTSDKLFSGVADTRSPQGIAALVRPRVATNEKLFPGAKLLMVLVGVQDPGNVGTIARAAEAYGATGLVTCPADGIG